jgi:hypothetical protein
MAWIECVILQAHLCAVVNGRRGYEGSGARFQGRNAPFNLQPHSLGLLHRPVLVEVPYGMFFQLYEALMRYNTLEIQLPAARLCPY